MLRTINYRPSRTLGLKCPLWVLFLFLSSPAIVSAQDTGFLYHEGRNLLVYGGSRCAWYMGQSNTILSRVVHVKDFRTGVDRILYRGTGTISQLRLSPTGEFVSFTERQWIENVPPEKANYIDRSYDERGNARRAFHYVNPQLVLVSLGGEVLDRLDSVYRYTWNPIGNRLGYLTGTYHEGGLGFRSTGVWIYDLGQGRPTKIADVGYEIYWSTFHDKLYVYNISGRSPVGWYDPSADAVVPTNLKCINFSPDGKHCFPVTVDTEFKLLALPGSEDITGQHPLLSQNPYISPVWSPDGQALVFQKDNGQSSNKVVIYNLTSRLANESAGMFAGFAVGRRRVAVVSPRTTEVHFEPW